MQRPALKDRRIFARIPSRLSLKFLNLRSNRECSAQTCDISAEGIGLTTAEALLAFTPLEICLHIPDEGQPLYTRGEAVWSKMIEPNKFRVGISLLKPDLMGISRVLRIKTAEVENSAGL